MYSALLLMSIRIVAMPDASRACKIDIGIADGFVGDVVMISNERIKLYQRTGKGLRINNSRKGYYFVRKE